MRSQMGKALNFSSQGGAIAPPTCVHGLSSATLWVPGNSHCICSKYDCSLFLEPINVEENPIKDVPTVVPSTSTSPRHSKPQGAQQSPASRCFSTYVWKACAWLFEVLVNLILSYLLFANNGYDGRVLLDARDIFDNMSGSHSMRQQ